MSDYKNAFVTIGQEEFVIVREKFEKEGGTGWFYERLKGGFSTEDEAKDYLVERLKEIN
ncbi:hypothetical protein GAG94_03125 [Lysinibacillus sphaericus]|nr:hypothetical protein GAG94_03125 [Lysinibacillus sphaericus]